MEKILIQAPQSAIAVATSIQQSLKKAGFNSTAGTLNLGKEKSLPLVVVAVVNNDSIHDKLMMDVLSVAESRNINVVPFVCDKLEPSILSSFFLDEHVWIDAQSQSSNDALDDLVDCMKNNFAALSKKAVKKSESTREASSSSHNAKNSKPANSGNAKGKAQADGGNLFKNLFYLALAVIVVLSFLLVKASSGLSNQEAINQQANLSNSRNNSNIQIQLNTDLKRSEQDLVGSWKMSDYNDNQFRATHQDSVALQQMIDVLVNRAQLVFNANKTFQRIGFSDTPENGSWEYDPQSHYLKLQPAGVNQYDVVQIQEVNDQKMVIVVQEKVENNNIITKMTFTKVSR